jgi:hypothetical protein
VLLGAFVAMAVFAPLLAPYSPTDNSFGRSEDMSAAHWLGTTAAGQDVLSQVISGARVSVFVGFAAGLFATIIAVLVGLTMVVFFNAVPELIYLARGQVRSFGLLMASARFVTQHWPEWLGPTVLMGAVVLAPFGLVQSGSAAERMLRLQSLFSVDGIVLVVLAMPLWLKPIMLLFITWAMMFRGLLFAALASGTARKRPWPT